MLHKIDPNVRLLNISDLLPYFKSIQMRDSGGWWSGADNVGMDHPPDDHPCMPGVPDDELDVLLLALAHNVARINTTLV